MGFIKKGKAAKREMAKVEAQIAQRDEEMKNRVFRFRLPDEEQTSITFLDGDLDDDGLLNIAMYYEHNMYQNGSYNHWYVCVGESEPCPICEGGSTPSFVGAFTVIDHTVWKDKKGVVHKDELKLFVAKRHTIKQLQTIAKKRGGLTGCTFDVTRTGPNSASVGSMFDFSEKKTLAALRKKYGQEIGPYNYEEVIQYLTAKELRKLGFGSAPVGSEDEYDEDDDNGDDDEDTPVTKGKPKVNPKYKKPSKYESDDDEDNDDDENDDDENDEEEDEEEYEEPVKKPVKKSYGASKVTPKIAPKAVSKSKFPKPKKASDEYDDFDDDVPF